MILQRKFLICELKIIYKLRYLKYISLSFSIVSNFNDKFLIFLIEKL